MCCFTGSAIVVWHPWSKWGLSVLIKRTSTDFIPYGLRYFNPKPFSYWPNALTTRLPSALPPSSLCKSILSSAFPISSADGDAIVLVVAGAVGVYSNISRGTETQRHRSSVYPWSWLTLSLWTSGLPYNLWRLVLNHVNTHEHTHIYRHYKRNRLLDICSGSNSLLCILNTDYITRTKHFQCRLWNTATHQPRNSDTSLCIEPNGLCLSS